MTIEEVSDNVDKLLTRLNDLSKELAELTESFNSFKQHYHTNVFRNPKPRIDKPK